MHHFTKIPPLRIIKEIVPELKACLFDMDGTLLNTENFHFLAVKNILLSKNIHFDEGELHLLCLGNTDEYIFNGLKLSYPCDDFIKEKNNEILNFPPLELQASLSYLMLNFLKEIKESKIKIALVTSSEKDLTMELLTKLNLKEYFSTILTREDTSQNKPFPAPYLKCLENLNIGSHEAFIFEDSLTGLEAARQSKIAYGKAAWY